MKKIVIVFILNSVLVINCFSQQSSGIFLELPSSVRAGGMEETFTALSDEPFGINYNPAGMAFVKSTVVSFLHQRYLLDISGNYFGFVISTKNLRCVAMSLRALATDLIGNKRSTVMQGQSRAFEGDIY